MLSLTSNYQNTTKKKIYAFALLLLWLILVTWLINDRQNILDWVSLIGYKEPLDISQLAAQDTMTAYAQGLFKLNKPEILDKSSFSKPCPNNGGEQTIVLGCYHPDQAGIFLLNETDPRLYGVEQVTAAHEMLHAAYDRLSSNEKAKVNAMLLDYYDHNLHDPRILGEIGIYKKTEPKAVVNEMHSVFGTEIANLPSGLEQYYKKYFTNRQVITNYAAKYQAEFTARQDQITEYNNELTQLKPQISSLELDLNSKSNTISSLQNQLNSFKNSGNIPAYNRGVPTYNNLIDQYNAEVDQIKSLTTQYNQIVNEVNNISLIENQLYQELSGNQTTINR
jgi:flagellar biosynthesis chaperone FliJ